VAAIEIMTVMKDQKPAGAITVLSGKMSAGYTKNSPLNDFLGMMQMTMSEYQNQNHTEENLATGSDDNQMGKIFLIKNDNPMQDNERSLRGEANASPGEIAIVPTDENSTDALNETIAMPAFINAFIIDKMFTGSKAVGADEVVADAFLATQKEGKKGLVGLKELLLNVTADDLGKQHKDILVSLAKKNHPLTEENLFTTMEMKNQLVMELDKKGFSSEEIKGILKAVKETTVKINSADQLLQTNNQPEMKNQLVMALDKKGFSPEEIKGILKAVEETTVKINSANQLLQTNNQPEMKNQLVMALDKKGFSPEEIKGILKAVEETTVKFNSADQLLQTNNQPEMKNQMVMALEEKGFSAEEIMGILKAVEETTVKFNSADQLLQTNNQPEMKNMMVMALEEKGIPADVVAGIIKELDQVITAKVLGAQENTERKSSAQVESPLPTSLQFRQDAVAILEKKGFSTDDIKGILKAVEQATVGGVKPDVPPRSDQPIFVQQSLYNKEFIKETTFGRKNIHADIYQKEASSDDFRNENVETKIKINPSEQQAVQNGFQKELIEQPENNQQSGKKNIFPGAIRGTENKQPIISDKEIAAPQIGKIIKATDQDDLGKWSKVSGDVTAKTGQTRHEDIILAAGREQSPLTSNILNMDTKGADFPTGKATMDTSKYIYQSVLDQVQESFTLAQNKDNGQVRLTLKPEIMGHLDMQITVRNETVQIMMTVENEKVHQAINAHIDDLKTALQNQGLKIDKIEVALQYKPDQEQTFYKDQANSGFNNPGQNTSHERMLNQELSLGDDHYPANIRGIIQKQNSMEGVSIFA